MRTGTLLEIQGDQVLRPHYPHRHACVIHLHGLSHRLGCELVVSRDDLHRYAGDHDVLRTLLIAALSSPFVDWRKRHERTGLREEDEDIEVEGGDRLRPEDQRDRTANRVIRDDAILL